MKDGKMDKIKGEIQIILKLKEQRESPDKENKEFKEIKKRIQNL